MIGARDAEPQARVAGRSTPCYRSWLPDPCAANPRIEVSPTVASPSENRPANPLTEGPILTSLVRLSGPIVATNLLQTAYQWIDTIWVGRVGATAVAAVSLSFPILFLLISLGIGLGIAGTVLVAQYKGRNDQTQIDHVAAQTMIAVVAVSVLIMIVGYLLTPELMALMNPPSAIYPDAVTYLQVIFLGMVFLFAYFVFQSLMRGVGDVRTPFLLVLGTVVLNSILDPFLILGWGPFPAMGVGGAALATIVSQGIAAVVGLALLASGHYEIHLRWRAYFRLDIPLIRRMFALGLPASVEQSTRALGLVAMTFLVASFDTTTVAAYGIGGRVLSFVIIPALGLAMATTTLVGQNVGAGQIERAEQITILSGQIGFVALTIVGGLFFWLAEPTARLFIPNDPDVIAVTVEFLRVMALSFGFVGLQQVISGAFRGAGDTKTAMLLAIILLWIFQFPIAYVLSKMTGLGPWGLWWSFPIANVIATVVAWVWFARGAWKTKQITGDDRLQQHVYREVLVDEGVEEA